MVGTWTFGEAIDAMLDQRARREHPEGQPGDLQQRLPRYREWLQQELETAEQNVREWLDDA
jgi:hypothetical protein